MAAHEQSRNNVISNCISNIIPPQMEMVIPILRASIDSSQNRVLRPHKTARHPTKCDILKLGVFNRS